MVRWDILEERRLGPSPFLCMGVVNVTPDSFSDGGRFLQAEAAIAHARRLAHEGADILDIGGESSRPGSQPVSAEEEWGRIGPVLTGLYASRDSSSVAAQSGGDSVRPPGPADLQGNVEANAKAKVQPNVPANAVTNAPAISVDTWRASTAAKALGAGAQIINDISACRFDPALEDVLVQHQPGYVLMHTLDHPKTMQRDPVYDNVVEDILRFLEDRLSRLVRAGLREDRIVLDPGIGFGKTLEHNLAILANLGRFASLCRPVLVGLSRKRFLQGFLVDGETDGAHAMQAATQAATVLAACHGATIHRVHDVALTRQSLALAAAVQTVKMEGAPQRAAFPREASGGVEVDEEGPGSPDVGMPRGALQGAVAFTAASAKEGAV